MLEAGEVVEVRAVRDRDDLTLRRALAHLCRDRVGNAHDRVRGARDQRRHGMLALLLQPNEHPLGIAVRVRDDRVTKVGDPRNADSAFDGRTDEMNRRGRRRRDDDVDAFALCDPDRGRDRGEVPADVLVRHEQPAPGELNLLRRTFEPRGAVQLLGRLAALRAEVARAVHPGEGRRRQPLVAMDPLGVVRSEHVRLDPELRQMRGELQRTLYPASSGGREVHRDQEHLHCGRR